MGICFGKYNDHRVGLRGAYLDSTGNRHQFTLPIRGPIALIMTLNKADLAFRTPAATSAKTFSQEYG